MPNFQNPVAFLFLLFIPLLYILRKLKIFTRISFPAVLGDWGGKNFEWNDKTLKFFSIVSKILIYVAFFIVVAAFADPVIAKQEKIYTSLGTDIVFVIDVSPSMAAKDMDGESRLDIAKKTIANLVTENDGVRLGIVALGSNASVVVPPTTDHQTVFQRISELHILMMGDGSAIGDGLSTAVCHMVSSSAPNKCIILLTDGESNAGSIHPETAAGLAKDNGISIYVVGIGSKGIVTLEYEDPNTGKIISGRYDSNFNAASLRKIAAIANGKYFETKSTEDLVSTIFNVTKKESVIQSFTYRTTNKLLYDVFLFWGILLFSIAWIIKLVFLHEKL
ncbi:MAG: VWA domain-containing protein [Treponema sp.]|nr:VWA domain-containing protein [Treponema sp.]